MAENGTEAAELAERELHRTSNRIAAVDIARVLTAFVVMYEHLSHYHLAGGTGNAIKYVSNWTIGTCSPIFFLFAGYFACRNITWKKALYNAWWCFAPFALWVGVAAVTVWRFDPGLWAESCNPITLLGLDSLFSGYSVNNSPINGPLWFMRDLTFFFLLSPLLYRWSRWLLPLLVLLGFLPDFGPLFESKPEQVFTLYSVGFFTLGCFLRQIPKERQQFLLRFHSKAFVGTFLGLGVLISSLGLACRLHDYCGIFDAYPTLRNVPLGIFAGMLDFLWHAGASWRHWSFIEAVAAIWVLYQTARCIEVHCPRLTRLGLKLAPVTFLTFAAHWPIYLYINTTPLRDSVWLVLMPPAIFALTALFFFALKRFCRPLLHLVAHYKLRPDD